MDSMAQQYDPENVFAKILREELPAHKVHEDAWSLAFMDLMPQTDGHTLVIPKCPARDLLDLDPEYMGPTLATAQKVARAVKQAFSAEGLMLVQLSGAAAGQTVFHVHFHILPRWDGLDLRMHARDPAPAEQLAEHARRIREALANEG